MKLPATVLSLVTQLLEATSTVCTPSVMTSPRRCTCCFLPSPPLPSPPSRVGRHGKGQASSFCATEPPSIFHHPSRQATTILCSQATGAHRRPPDAHRTNHGFGFSPAQTQNPLSLSPGPLRIANGLDSATPLELTRYDTRHNLAQHPPPRKM
jgi:hypothetical protein